MEEAKKCACGMPLDDKTECKCEKGVCIHCCNCDDDCDCGCKKKSEEDKEDDNEEGCSGCCASCHAHDDKE